MEFSCKTEEVIKGNYSSDLEKMREGILSKLGTQMNQMSRRIELSLSSLEKEKENSDIRVTILEAVNGIYLKAIKKNIQVNLEKLKEFNIPHNPKWTKEAIFNILDNAVKYSNEYGFITISMIETEFYLKIDITDTGIGIPKDEFNNIFKRFYRGKDNIVKSKEGSGIGLYLTRKILEDEGGSIMVDSIVGKGSKFSIYLQNCK